MAYDAIYIKHMNIETRPQRRKAIEVLSAEIGKILFEEEQYQKRIPHGLHNSVRFYESDLSINMLLDAYLILIDAF